MKGIIAKASKKQLQFWLKMLQDEVRSMEKRLVVKKEMIELLKKGLKKKKAK